MAGFGDKLLDFFACRRARAIGHGVSRLAPARAERRADAAGAKNGDFQATAPVTISNRRIMLPLVEIGEVHRSLFVRSCVRRQRSTATSDASKEDHSDGRRVAAVDRVAVCGVAVVHCHLAADGRPLVGAQPQQGNHCRRSGRRSSRFTWLPRMGSAGAGTNLLDKLQEYVSFIILLGALYVISGGIYVKGSLSGTPLANTGAAGDRRGAGQHHRHDRRFGAADSSAAAGQQDAAGTRPTSSSSSSSSSRNCGGLLTPLGDPPLFLGFLKGRAVLWTLEHLWPQWLVVNMALLADLQRLGPGRVRPRRAGSGPARSSKR